FDPQYEFGFGLNYSPVKTNSLKLIDGNEYYLGDSIRVEVELENIGDRTSTEVVMLYSQDLVASITPSVDKLKAYKRLSLEPGEIKRVILSFSSNDLGFIDQNLNYIVEPGLFNLRVKDQIASMSIVH
ncbi:MAG: beta-glucosidase, partial [Crocinitomicaceae bacterium]|nr:beta-glucosidase [Crocinitomicaceae bacterium]